MCDAVVYGTNFTTTSRNKSLLYARMEVFVKFLLDRTASHTKKTDVLVTVVRTSSHIDSCDFAWFPVACHCERDNERTVDVL